MIQRIGSGTTEANTITIPAGHKQGDILLICAFRDGNTTNPTIPAGWTNITNTFDGTTCSVSCGYKVATSAAETSGTWSNASVLMVVVYRGAKQVSPFGTPTNTAATGANLTYGAVTMNRSTSWLVAFACHRSIDTTTLTTAPTSMTLVVSGLGATSDVSIFDTNRTYVSGNYASNNVAHGGTNSGNQTMVMEVKDAQLSVMNYSSLSSTGGSLTEGIL